MHQIRFRPKLRPEPRWGSLRCSPGRGAYGAPTVPLAGLRGSTSKRRGGERKGDKGNESGGEGERKGKGRRKEGRGGKENRNIPPSIPEYDTENVK